jgi:hypothetical protein
MLLSLSVLATPGSTSMCLSGAQGGPGELTPYSLEPPQLGIQRINDMVTFCFEGN